jgi:HD-GYP domain-containing protein (c-di-GMP phosphodiesterase class II)
VAETIRGPTFPRRFGEYVFQTALDAVTSTEFRDEDGHLITVSMLRDISAVKRLQAELRATVESMGKPVQARDPYTAGHERRVADIAERIGKELELPAEQLSGLRITGLIHDVGKIGVPSEILSKPKLPYLADLGVSAIQLLPIQEFPSTFSLGYNGVDYCERQG